MHTLRHSARHCVSLMGIAAGLLILLQSAASHSIEPDIPQIQADAERGSVQYEIKLGTAYLAGRGVIQDEKQAAYWYEKAANAGDPFAENQIGYLYQVGLGVTRDPVRAVHWYELAAAGGFPKAKVNLGVAYLWGVGVKKDKGLAAQLFTEAAAKGSGLGACYLGNMYLLGEGMQKDRSAARHWFEVGVKLGDPRAEYSLGLFLSTDPARTEDLKRAVKLMRASADAGLVAAKHELGYLLVQNPQLAHSPKEAVALLEAAAAAGSWKSSLILGVLARDGRGASVDLEGAYYHFRVATLQGGDTASELLRNDLQILAAKLGAERARAVDSDAGAWYQTHHLSLAYVYQSGENWKQDPFFALESPEGDIHAGRIIPTSPFSSSITSDATGLD